MALGANSYGNVFNLSTGGNSTIDIAGFTLTGGTSVTLTAGGSGDIEDSVGTGSIATSALHLETTTGVIGPAFSVGTTATTLYLNDTTSNQTGAVRVTDTQTSGTVALGANAYSSTFNLHTGGATFNIAGFKLTAASQAFVDVVGSGNIEQTTGGSISTPTLSLLSNSGAVGPVSGSFVALQVNASTLSVNNSTNTTGDVNIVDTPTGGTVAFGASSYGNNFNLSTLSNGNIDLHGFTVGGHTSVTLTANGAGNIDDSVGGAQVSTPALHLETTTGSIGATHPIDTTAATLYVNDTTSNVTGNVSIGGSPTGGTVALGANSYGNVFNLSIASGYGIDIAGFTLTGGTSVTLSAGGDGTIDDSVGTGLVSAPAVHLESGTGTIGVTNNIATNASTLYVNDATSNETGDVNVTDTPTGGTVAFGAAYTAIISTSRRHLMDR